MMLIKSPHNEAKELLVGRTQGVGEMYCADC